MAIGTGAAILGGTVLGGLASGLAANKAAKTQANAANRATDAELQMFNQTRQDNMPWLNAGEGGLNALMGLMNMQKGADGEWTRNSNPNAYRQFLQLDPSYQFRFNEGRRAIENSAAARGGLLSGNAIKELTNYGQNAASQEFGNVYNRLAGLANTGQATGQYLGNAGMQTGQSIGNNMMQAGAARASGYAGMGNALNGMINNGLGAYGAYKNGFFG